MSKMTLVLEPGDEFAYNEFPELARHHYGGATIEADPDESSQIEVFEDTSRILNLYSIPDADRMRVLTDDFGGNHILAYQFSTIIKREAHIRAQFQRHANPDIMMRQLIIIGQDPNIFPSRIIIPHVRIVGESYIDILARTSVTTVAHKVVRSTKRARNDARKTTAMRLISSSTQSDNERANVPDTSDDVKRRAVQFPFPILSIVERAQGVSHRMMISPSMSVMIDSVDIVPLGKYPHINPFWFAQAIDPERKTSWVRDRMQWREDQPIETLPSDRSRVIPRIAVSQTYDYLRALFRFLFSARPHNLHEVDAKSAVTLSSDGDMFVDRETADSDARAIHVVTLDPKYARVLDTLAMLADAAGFSISATSTASILMEFLSHGLLHVYLQIIGALIATEFAPDTMNARAIERMRIEADGIARQWVTEISMRASSRTENARIDEGFARIYTLARIIIDTIGRARVSALIARDGTLESAGLLSVNPMRVMAQDIGANMDQSGLRQSAYLGIREDELLSILDTRERAYVLARLEALLRAPPSVECKHVNVLRALRAVVSASSARRALSDCNNVFDLAPVTADYTELVPCLLCGTRVCCPHIINLVRAIEQRATYQEERTVLSPYIAKSRDVDTYYCIVCGVVFDWNRINDDDRDNVRKSATDKELTDMIFHEIALTNRMIRATGVPDQTIFHRAIVRHIYPFIEIASSRIYVTQTSATDVARAKLRIFVAIYIFADCIVNMDAMGIVFEGFRLDARDAKQSREKTARAIKFAIDKIMSVENVQLNIVPNFTRDMVSENLITAVAQLRRVAHVMPSEQQVIDYRNILYLDPVFEFLVSDWIGFIIPRAGDSSTKSGKARDPVMILPPARDIRTSNGDSVNIYARLLAKKRVTDDGMSMFLAHLRTIYENRIFAYPLATTDAKILNMLEKMASDNATMRAKDREIRAMITVLIRIAPTRAILRDGRNALSFPFVRAHLSELYDEHGVAHEWTTYVIARTSDDTLREYKPSNGHPLVLAPGEYIKDRKCATCGHTMLDARDINEGAIWSALANREMIDDFYKFYSVRCPEGGEHEYARVEDGCKKCGISSSLDARVRGEYFDKYVGAFREYIGQPLANDSTLLFETVTRRDGDIVTLEKAANDFISQPWTYNYGAIIACAEVLGVASSRIQSIGARDGLTDDELMSKSYVVREPTSQDDTRILALRGVITELLNAYAVLRNISKHMKIRQRNVAQLIDDVRKRANVTGAQFDQECANLPNWNTILARTYPIITDSLDAENIISRILVEFALGINEPAEIANYFLEMFANLIRALADQGGLCDIFAREFFASVDARQNMTMKNKFFNVLVLEGTKLKDARENKYANDEIDDDAVQDVEYDIDDDERDPFSLDSFDVDDDDDAGVDMKLGRDIGW